MIQPILPLTTTIIGQPLARTRRKSLPVSLSEEVLGVAPSRPLALGCRDFAFVEVCGHAVHAGLVHVHLGDLQRVERVVGVLSRLHDVGGGREFCVEAVPGDGVHYRLHQDGVVVLQAAGARSEVFEVDLRWELLAFGVSSAGYSLSRLTF